MKAVAHPSISRNRSRPIRDKLHLKTGMIMDFDETSPYLKATPVTDEAEEEIMSEEEFQKWIAESVGIAKGKFTTDEMMRETRGKTDGASGSCGCQCADRLADWRSRTHGLVSRANQHRPREWRGACESDCVCRNRPDLRL
jgi:hypothetical protein